MTIPRFSISQRSFLKCREILRIDTAQSVGEALDKTKMAKYDGIISDVRDAQHKRY